ncbi:Nuclear pore complex protein NUP160-like protein [Drosera capensis]
MCRTRSWFLCFTLIATYKFGIFFGREKILSHYLHVPGTIAARMWVGEFSHDSNAIPLAVMHKKTLEVSVEGIYTYVADLKLGGSMSLLLNTSEPFIPLTERELVDVRLTSDKIWVLKEDGLLGQDLFGPNRKMGWQFYALHEEFVADQLFQTSKHSLDLLFQIAASIFSNAKAQMLAFISSIFLHRLLHPGVQNTGVLRATLTDYKKQWTDSEFHGLSVEDLRREILSLIEQEALSGSIFSIFKCWSKLCVRYFKLWCKRNKPHGLLVDSLSGSIGLIRKDSFSLFRCLEDIELLVHGAFNDFDDLKSGLVICGDSDEKRILAEVLLCCRIFSQHFGSEVAFLFYQSAISFSMISIEDLVLHLLKGLRSGCNYSLAKLDASEQGIDLVHQNLNAAQKELRGFSVDMLVSLHGLCSKANGWHKILHAIEYYLNYLVPSMSEQSSESGKIINVIASVVVQATPQIAGAMFEFALEIMLFLNYLISINGQICMPDADVIKVKLELIPMVHEIIVEWLLIYIFSTTPAQSLAEENFSLQFSSLEIDGNTSKPEWMEKINVMNVTLDYVLILNAKIYSPNWKSQYSSCLPSPWNLTSMVKNFISWTIRGPSGKGFSYAFGHLTELALVLLRHGQYNAVELGRLLFVLFNQSFLAAAATGSDALWRLNYYQWVMQLFELYNTSEAAYDFALAALEQVDEAMPHDSCGTNEITDESASAVKGRLWANIFKFTLDLGRYYDAYCAIISNPDEESKCICLRRFIIVLCERGATKILCDGELPFVGLTEKVERELACKAACSDILLKPNFYKLLYAYEMRQQNWRKAASYIYLNSAKLVTEAANSPSLALQERLNGISAAINALHLRLEDEFVLASAEYLLLSANVPWIPTVVINILLSGDKTLPSDLVDLLVKKNLYDMAFTIILRFWKGSGQKRELERVFSAMSLKCCNTEASSPLSGSNGFLLKSSVDDPTMSGAFDTNALTKHRISNTLWEMLEVYLEKYKALHARLPAVVADTLLGSDRQIELPRWLVNMFKGTQQERTFGMTGQDCDAASLFRLYVDYGRYKEAADLLVEYIDAYASTLKRDSEDALSSAMG